LPAGLGRLHIQPGRQGCLRSQEVSKENIL
jgi:hypothetical protein